MKPEYLDPARTIIDKIGIDKVAEITGKHVSRVYRWMYPKERGGTGGLIPQSDAPALLRHAQANGIDLTPGDFFPAPAEAAE
jgi:transposase